MFMRHCTHTPAKPETKPETKPEILETKPDKVTTIKVDGVYYSYDLHGKLHMVGKPAIYDLNPYIHTDKPGGLRNKNNNYYYTHGVITRDGRLPAVYNARGVADNIEDYGSYAFVKDGIAYNPDRKTPAMYNEELGVKVFCEGGKPDRDFGASVIFEKQNKEFYIRGGPGSGGDGESYIRYAKANGMPLNPCREIVAFMELRPKPTYWESRSWRFFWEK